MKPKYLLFIIVLLLFLLLASCTKDETSKEKVKNVKEDEEIYKSSGYELIELPYRFYSQPKILGNNIYMCVADKSQTLNKLIKYDTDTKETETIFKSKFKNPAVQSTMINDKWLLWVDSNESGYENVTYVQNLKTLEIKEIYRSLPQFLTVDAPFLYESYVAWIYLNEREEKQVILYDLETDEKKIISNLNDYGLYNNFLNLANNSLVWTDNKGEIGYYYVYNIETEEIKEIKSSYKYPSYAEIVGNKIFSINFQDIKDWEDQEFGYIDIDTGNYTKVKDKYINGFRTNDKFVGILTNENKIEFYQNYKEKLLDISLDIPFEYIDTIDFSPKHLVLGRVSEGDIMTQLLIYTLK